MELCPATTAYSNTSAAAYWSPQRPFRHDQLREQPLPEHVPHSSPSRTTTATTFVRGCSWWRGRWSTSWYVARAPNLPVSPQIKTQHILFNTHINHHSFFSLLYFFYFIYHIRNISRTRRVRALYTTQHDTHAMSQRAPVMLIVLPRTFRIVLWGGKKVSDSVYCY